MPSDGRLARRFASAWSAAGEHLPVAEFALRTERWSAAVNNAHAVVHNSVVAHRNLRLGRSGRLLHGRVSRAAVEAGMPEPLAEAVGFVENLYPRTVYGGRPATPEQARRAIEIAGAVVAFVSSEAERAGLLPRENLRRTRATSR